MSLETGSYINDLVASNPPGTDPKSSGDDHLRLIKTALKNCFAGFTGAILVTGTDGGVINAYTLTPSNAIVAYVNRMIAIFSPIAANSGAATINISGLGVKSLTAVDGTALVANDLTPGLAYAAVYNGTEFRLLYATKNYIDQKAFATALPAQALGFLRSDGTASAFTKKHTGYAQDEVKGADVPSAATVDLQTATGNFVHITGTTSITAVTLDSGAEREVVFDGVLTLTNGASLILPSGANITTAAGDCATFRGEPSGVVRVVKYQKASGFAVTFTQPGMVLIAGPLVPTAAANVDFLNVFSSTYDDYLIVVSGVTTGAGSEELRIQLAIAGVADTAANYRYCPIDDPTAGSGGSFWPIGQADAGNRPTGANVRLSGMNSTIESGKRMDSIGDVVPIVGGSPLVSRSNVGVHNGSNVATGFRLFWGAGGNFVAQGSIKVYGLSKV